MRRAAIVLLLILGGQCPAHAQDITYEARGVTLREALAQFAALTGYEFGFSALGNQAEDIEHDVNLRGVSLAEALKVVGDTWGCDFFSLEYSGFRAIPRRKPDPPVADVAPFELSTSPPSPASSDGRRLSLALMFTADAEKLVERIARLGPDLRIIDNFGRSMLPPEDSPTRGTAAPRVKLLEYRHRLALRMPDTRAVRIRLVAGTLELYRQVRPARAEFALAGPQPGAYSGDGVEMTLENPRFDGRNFTARVRMSWPVETQVSGRGVSRNVLPYIVDERGRIYRDFGPRASKVIADGRETHQQDLRFDGMQGRPVRLAYDFWVKTDPSESIPFRLAGIPLPTPASPFKPEQRPFYVAQGGGALNLRVVDRSGAAIEGELSLGLARKTAGGFGGTRWIDLVTDPQGRARLDRIEPGRYRVTRQFRVAPGAKPVTDPGGPVTVTIVRGGEAHLPPLNSGLQAGAE